MGYASKLEDENERRTNEGASCRRRFVWALQLYGVDSAPLENSRPLPFDERSREEISSILGRIEVAYRKMYSHNIKSLSGKTAKKLLKLHGDYRAELTNLIQFIAPRTRLMSGEQQRSWIRVVNQLKRARILLR